MDHNLAIDTNTSRVTLINNSCGGKLTPSLNSCSMISPLVPPGFRFHPTDEELVNYYLRKKVNMEAFDLDVIKDVDLNKLEPWDLHGKLLKILIVSNV